MNNNIEDKHIYSYFFFSALIHAVLLSFILMLPLHGSATDQIFLTRLVSIDELTKAEPVEPVSIISNTQIRPSKKIQKINSIKKITPPIMKNDEYQVPKNELAQVAKNITPDIAEHTADDIQAPKEDPLVSEKESSDNKMIEEDDTPSSTTPEVQTEGEVPAQYQETKKDVMSEGEKMAENVHSEQEEVMNEIQVSEKKNTDETPQVNPDENIPPETSGNNVNEENNIPSSPIPDGQTEGDVPAHYQDTRDDTISYGEKIPENVDTEQEQVINEILSPPAQSADNLVEEESMPVSPPEEPSEPEESLPSDPIDELPRTTASAEAPAGNDPQAQDAETTEPEEESKRDDIADKQSPENEMPSPPARSTDHLVEEESMPPSPPEELSEPEESLPSDPIDKLSGAAASAEAPAGIDPHGENTDTIAPIDTAQSSTSTRETGLINEPIPTVQKEVEGNGLMGSVPGIPLPEIFAPKDIRIEIQPTGKSEPDLSVSLSWKPYIKSTWKVIETKPQSVEFLKENTEVEMNGVKKPGIVISVSVAEKGIYSFSILNTGQDALEYGINFLLYEGKEKDRAKEYASLYIPAGSSVNFRFILPDLVFWDDDTSFTGVIEDSTAITKFIYDTGLVWRERKE